MNLQQATTLARNGDAGALVETLWPRTRLDRHQRQALDLGLSCQVAELYSKGCTASGKTEAAGMLGCCWLALNPSCRVVVTSQRFEHAKSVMFTALSNRWRRSEALMKLAQPGREGIVVNEDRFLMIASPESGEGFSGMHSIATLFIFDEASSVPDQYRDLANTQAKLIVALSNPRRATGWFRRGFDPNDPNTTKIIPGPFGPRLCQTIRGGDCLNVIEGKTIIHGQLTRRKYEGLLQHHEPRWVSIFAHGEFPAEDLEFGLIFNSWLPRHHAAWTPAISVDSFGLDVGDGGDKSIIAAGGREGCARLHTRQKSGTMQTVAWALSIAQDVYGINLRNGIVPVVVDGDGIGKGVADRLIELGVQVITFRASATADDPRSFANARAEAYGMLARRLDPKGPWGDEAWALPSDPDLDAELCAPEKIYSSDGIRYHITPKTRQSSTFEGETLHEKLGRSPDKGDALAYLSTAVRRTFWNERIRINRPVVIDLDAIRKIAAGEGESGNPQKCAFSGNRKSALLPDDATVTDFREFFKANPAAAATEDLRGLLMEYEELEK